MRGGEVPRGREGAEVDLLGELGHDAVLHHLHHLLGAPGELLRARKLSEGTRRFYNHGEGPYTKTFSLLKVPTSAFTF